MGLDGTTVTVERGPFPSSSSFTEGISFSVIFLLTRITHTQQCFQNKKEPAVGFFNQKVVIGKKNNEVFAKKLILNTCLLEKSNLCNVFLSFFRRF